LVFLIHTIMYSFKGWQNNKNHTFPSKRCKNNGKTCYFDTFYKESYTTYLCTTRNKKILLQNILAYCGYSPTCQFFLLLSEHKHCNNAATNSNSENARSRMVTSLQGSLGMGTKEVESSTGRFWVAGFHRVTARSAWRAFWNLWTVYDFNFPISVSPSRPRLTADITLPGEKTPQS